MFSSARTAILPTILALYSSLPCAHCIDHINLGAFTQTATYSVANQLGFFQAYGLNVTYLQIPNSTYGYSTLLSGGYDILTGTIDNAVNLRFNSNKSVTVLGQLDAGPDLALASATNITSILDLKGKSLIVDSATSGYSYILQKILALYGLHLANGDYNFTVVGATSLRYAALLNGTLSDGASVSATILTYPFTGYIASLPASKAPNILARLSDFMLPFSSSAFTVAQSTLSNSTARNKITRFVAAMHDANVFLAASTNVTQACSVKAIATQLNVTTETAEREYVAATNVMTGETATAQAGNFTVDRMGLLNVIDVRGQFRGFPNVSSSFNFAEAILPGQGKLIDYSIRDAAVASSISYVPKCA